MREREYGMLTSDFEKSATEICFENVINTAKEMGMNVVEGETDISVDFVSDLINRLKNQIESEKSASCRVFVQFTLDLMKFAEDNWTPLQADMRERALYCVAAGEKTYTEGSEEEC
mgnify:CR=1 FL=1